MKVQGEEGMDVLTVGEKLWAHSEESEGGDGANLRTKKREKALRWFAKMGSPNACLKD